MSDSETERSILERQPPPRLSEAAIEKLSVELLSVQKSILAAESSQQKLLDRVHADQRMSARNLVHYVALRHRDLRPLQKELTQNGLSSLGRCESHVLDNVNAVLEILVRVTGQPVREDHLPLACGLDEAQELINRRTEALFGSLHKTQIAHIMVTMPREAADDRDLVCELLKHGTSCIRINCSHDDPEIWLEMINNLRQAEEHVGRSCRVAVDLVGPKLRTGSLPFGIKSINLRPGDSLVIVGDQWRHSAGEALTAQIPHLACTLSQVLRDIRPGERILFDDGKIGGIISEAHPDRLLVKITATTAKGSKLRGDKGINLPDSDLRLNALTEKDIADLDFITRHADIVSYSFVRRPEDVQHLQRELADRGRPDMPIILKIENRQAFQRLPSLLLQLMQSPLAGIMIARGDLAVEMGFERLAEVQEEILWICEAAHVPVVWATQVLEQLAKQGLPSRAEVTDAAMSVRAECVMLNKGPYIVNAVRSLHDILSRMQSHQDKKRPKFRRLKLADDLAEDLS